MSRLPLALVLLVGCGSQAGGVVDGPRSPDAATDGPGSDAPGRARFRDCRGRAFTPAPREDWRHSVATPITTAAGAANHSAQDPIGPPGTAAGVHGKFTYGLISKDLQDEKIGVWLDDCSGWVALGTPVTDSDGRIAVDVAAARLPDPGVYEVRMQVLGDGSQTRAYVWKLPAGTHLAVSDIDGTLTSSDAQLFQQILDGSHVPVAYPGAVGLTTAHRGRGHVVVYLTGRPYYLTQKSRDWLAGLGFAVGPLHGTDSNGEALPTQGGVGDYKKRYLDSLRAAGYVLDLAYGNATTDIYAYLGTGLAADRVWIIGSNAGMQGTHAVNGDWGPRAAEVAAGPLVTQPFDW